MPIGIRSFNLQILFLIELKRANHHRDIFRKYFSVWQTCHFSSSSRCPNQSPLIPRLFRPLQRYSIWLRIGFVSVKRTKQENDITLCQRFMWQVALCIQTDTKAKKQHSTNASSEPRYKLNLFYWRRILLKPIALYLIHGGGEWEKMANSANMPSNISFGMSVLLLISDINGCVFLVRSNIELAATKIQRFSIMARRRRSVNDTQTGTGTSAKSGVSKEFEGLQ